MRRSATPSKRYLQITDGESPTNNLTLFDAAVSSQQGKRPYQEDEVAIRVCKSPDSNATENSNPSHPAQFKIGDTFIFGIFDGHAGGRCSKFISRKVPDTLFNDPSFHTNIPKAINDTFKHVNEEFLVIADHTQLNDGSTCLVAIIRNDKIIVANVGDCRAILISDNCQKVMPLSFDQKPSNENEKKRIERLGGTVVTKLGTCRVNGKLAVARAFGNRNLRDVIRPDPEITETQLQHNDNYLILATDGCWDVLKNTDMMLVCSMLQNKSCQYISHEITTLAINRGSMDNCTAIVVNVSKYVRELYQMNRENNRPSQLIIEKRNMDTNNDKNTVGNTSNSELKKNEDTNNTTTNTSNTTNNNNKSSTSTSSTNNTHNASSTVSGSSTAGGGGGGGGGVKGNMMTSPPYSPEREEFIKKMSAAFPMPASSTTTTSATTTSTTSSSTTTTTTSATSSGSNMNNMSSPSRKVYMTSTSPITVNNTTNTSNTISKMNTTTSSNISSSNNRNSNTNNNDQSDSNDLVTIRLHSPVSKLTTTTATTSKESKASPTRNTTTNTNNNNRMNINTSLDDTTTTTTTTTSTMTNIGLSNTTLVHVAESKGMFSTSLSPTHMMENMKLNNSDMSPSHLTMSPSRNTTMSPTHHKISNMSLSKNTTLYPLIAEEKVTPSSTNTTTSSSNSSSDSEAKDKKSQSSKSLSDINMVDSGNSNENSTNEKMAESKSKTPISTTNANTNTNTNNNRSNLSSSSKQSNGLNSTMNTLNVQTPHRRPLTTNSINSGSNSSSTSPRSALSHSTSLNVTDSSHSNNVTKQSNGKVMHRMLQAYDDSQLPLYSNSSNNTPISSQQQQNSSSYQSNTPLSNIRKSLNTTTPINSSSSSSSTIVYSQDMHLSTSTGTGGSSTPSNRPSFGTRTTSTPLSVSSNMDNAIHKLFNDTHMNSNNNNNNNSVNTSTTATTSGNNNRNTVSSPVSSQNTSTTTSIRKLNSTSNSNSNMSSNSNNNTNGGSQSVGNASLNLRALQLLKQSSADTPVRAHTLPVRPNTSSVIPISSSSMSPRYNGNDSHYMRAITPNRLMSSSRYQHINQYNQNRNTAMSNNNNNNASTTTPTNTNTLIKRPAHTTIQDNISMTKPRSATLG